MIGERWKGFLLGGVALLCGAAGLWALASTDAAMSHPAQESSAPVPRSAGQLESERPAAEGSSLIAPPEISTRAGSRQPETETATATGRSGTNVDVSCPPASPHAIQGGGVSSSASALPSLTAPLSGNHLAANGDRPTGWRVRYESGQGRVSKVRVYVRCAA